MKKKTIIVTLIFAISTAIQVISNIVLTRLFGTSSDYSHFLAAVTIPTILVSVIYGTLNDALMPLFGEKLAIDKDKAYKFFFGQLSTLTFLGIILSGLLFAFAQPLMSLFFSGQFLELNTLTQMFSLLILAIPFSIFVTVLGMRQYAEKNYNRFPLAQLIGSIINLVLILVLYQRFGAWAIIYSFVINIIVQIFFVLPGKLEFRIDHIIPTLSLWLPLIIGVTALKSDTLIIRSFSSRLGGDFIVYQNLISKVASLSAGLLTIGMQVLLLPNVIESIAKKELRHTENLVNKAKFYAISLSAVLAVAIYFFAPIVIRILFVGGRFTISDYESTVRLIPYYLLPVIGWGIVSVFMPPLYALKKHVQIGLVNLICFVLAWGMTSYMSQFNISLAISVGLTVLLLGSSIGAEILWQIHFRKLTSQ